MVFAWTTPQHAHYRDYNHCSKQWSSDTSCCLWIDRISGPWFRLAYSDTWCYIVTGHRGALVAIIWYVPCRVLFWLGRCFYRGVKGKGGREIWFLTSRQHDLRFVSSATTTMQHLANVFTTSCKCIFRKYSCHRIFHSDIHALVKLIWGCCNSHHTTTTSVVYTSPVVY